MPIATLQFNLPEEADEYRCAIDGMKYKSALQDLAQAFRDKEKYSEDMGCWADARELFWSTMEADGVELD